MERHLRLVSGREGDRVPVVSMSIRKDGTGYLDVDHPALRLLPFRTMRYFLSQLGVLHSQLLRAYVDPQNAGTRIGEEIIVLRMFLDEREEGCVDFSGEEDFNHIPRETLEMVIGSLEAFRFDMSAITLDLLNELIR
jgi:hypothetical protein